MGAYDTLAAAAVPCPVCGDLYWESCQTKFFDPEYENQAYLHPGQGRILDIDPSGINRAEVWDGEWLRLGETTRPDRVTLLLGEWELRNCSCGAVLMPVADLAFTSTGPDAGTMTFVSLELCDLRDPSTLARIDFVDSDWTRLRGGADWSWERFEAFGKLPRHARRALVASVIAAQLAPPSNASQTAAADHGGWSSLHGPTRCEACGHTRTVRSDCAVSNPGDRLLPGGAGTGDLFFGDAWTGGELTPGTRLGPIPAALATDRLRGRYYRLREPVPAELVLLDARGSSGCRCGAGRASVRIHFRRDGEHLILTEITWRVVGARADLADIDWIETRRARSLARTDLDDAERLRDVLAELDISEP